MANQTQNILELRINHTKMDVIKLLASDSVLQVYFFMMTSQVAWREYTGFKNENENYHVCSAQKQFLANMYFSRSK